MLTILDSLFAQKQTDLRIVVDSGINKNNLFVTFDNGLGNAVFDRTSFFDDTLHITERFDVPYARVIVSLKDKVSQLYFIGEQPTAIHIHSRRNGQPAAWIEAGVNAKAVYDTLANDVYKALRSDQITELNELNQLFIKYGNELNSNDSLKNEQVRIVKTINSKSMHFLKDYADDYFSFFYFIDQVLGLSDLVGEDPAYFQELLVYMQETFPKQYLTSSEGGAVAQKIEEKIGLHSLDVDSIAPDITLIETSGRKVNLRSLNAKYTLLDFWATWCGPCLLEIPKLIQLRDKFSSDQLEIVSISLDSDTSSCMDFIKKHGMDWGHVFDRRENTVTRIFGVHFIPSIVLIDRQGKIIYRNTGTTDYSLLAKRIADDR